MNTAHTHPFSPSKDNILFQQVSIIQVFEDNGDTWQQLNLVELHDTLKASQQILLGFLVIVTELWEY